MAATVILFEDNAHLRSSVESLIQISDEFILLGSFSHCLDAEHEVTGLRPDVVLMDIDMPGRNGIDAVRRIRQHDKKVQIVMLTVFDDNRHVLDALEAGANGYLLKRHISERLYSSLADVLDGGAPMSPSIARMIVEGMHAPEASKKDYGLSPRETEVLLQLSQGNSFKIIADHLDLSVLTVRTHIRNIYEKLQVRSQTEAVSKAIKEKLV